MHELIVKSFKELQDYQTLFQAMQDLNSTRSKDTPDEIWCLEHFPVFTQGLAGKPEHVLNPKDIPIIKTDRGGQVTYHGPGQLVVYFMLDLHRHKLKVRQLVTLLENTIINSLAHLDINAQTKPKAPGVYVDESKICSLGLRIRNGCSYHGLALNVDMDLEPFKRINPCGYENLKMTQIKDFSPSTTLGDIKKIYLDELIQALDLPIKCSFLNQ